MMCGSFVFSFILGMVYFFFAEHFFVVLNIPDEILKECVILIRIYSVGFIIQPAGNILYSVFEGFGNSKAPLMISLIGQGINIVLDVIVVAGLHMGANGAAYASLLSLLFAVIVSWIVLQKTVKNFDKAERIIDADTMGKYIKISIPSMLQQSIMSIGSLLLIRLVNMDGIEAINGYAISNNINNFLIIPIIAYTSAFESFASQNVGAKKEDRVWGGFCSLMLQGGISCLLLAFFCVFGRGLRIQRTS